LPTPFGFEIMGLKGGRPRGDMPNKSRIRNIFSSVAPHIDILSTALSFGLSSKWRRTAVSLSGIKRGDRVLDVCTGTGELALLLAKKVGREGGVMGIDFCRNMLSLAEQKAQKRINPHPLPVSFELSDANRLQFPDMSFDAATVAFGIRNIPDNSSALKEIYRVLKPGGRFLCLELTRPEKKWFLPIYKCYLFRVMPFVGKVITKSDVPYSYLPRSIFSFHSRDEFKRLIEQCGFSSVRAHPMTFGVATVYEAEKGH
jgi:demethylmenaquinone methyltransferase/2-methoxy-6-polyprenyl-1,4-benzoquinol methylase